jgi:uncharacterized protein (TIGR02246 family)
MATPKQQRSAAETGDEERAIRAMIEAWIAATNAGDFAKVQELMADDVVFMTPGQAPFGKELFEANARKLANVRIHAEADVRELTVLGDWAWCQTHLTVTVTPPDAPPEIRTGYALSILNKVPKRGWVIARDANLLTAA